MTDPQPEPATTAPAASSAVGAGQSPCWLLRDRFVTEQGELVLELHLWRDQADYAMRPRRPRAAHDVLWKAGASISADSINRIAASLLDANGDGTIAVRYDHKRGTADPHGWLTHPGVAALKVTK
jgi:hypothetical protein